MTKGDFWDKFGKWNDPLNEFDYDNDGVHNEDEAMDAEYWDIKRSKDSCKTSYTSLYDDDNDDYDDDDDDYDDDDDDYDDDF